MFELQCNAMYHLSLNSNVLFSAVRVLYICQTWKYIFFFNPSFYLNSGADLGYGNFFVKYVHSFSFVARIYFLGNLTTKENDLKLSNNSEIGGMYILNLF